MAWERVNGLKGFSFPASKMLLTEVSADAFAGALDSSIKAPFGNKSMLVSNWPNYSKDYSDLVLLRIQRTWNKMNIRCSSHWDLDKCVSRRCGA